MTLEEIRTLVTRASDVLADTGLYPEVRMNAAYGLLVEVSASRPDVPATLRPTFDRLWAAYHRAEPRIGEILAARSRYSFYSSKDFEDCDRLTLEFGQALDAELAARGPAPGTPTEPAPEGPAEHETESPADENSSRAAGD